MQKNSMKNTGMLFLAALIWGFAFVAQSAGMDYVGPFTFNAVCDWCHCAGSGGSFMEAGERSSGWK